MLYLSSTLLLAATCLLVSTGAEITTTCGTHVHRLSTETGVIRVQTALYGRANGETCSGGKTDAELANTACSLEGAGDIIQTRCNGKKVCELNKSIFPTDPCSDTFKYLETTYICIPATHLITCEHSMAHLKCGDGLVISVLGADFGRRDETTCSFKKPKEQITNVNCSNPTKKVAERCNLKESCTMRASSSVFEDSCVNTYKYLEVSY
ncbi:L-rhamnose-binding lectin SML-like, partial [Brachyistius frenatus]|uniref:L-rhamnose-binding lectin SML-like n=1 Tax=Brachyistius frenatus TaxID=100188 RepID=UPI0037E89016